MEFRRVLFRSEIDIIAKQMGSVNTVVKLPDGKLKGYNTDGIGCIKSLQIEGGLDLSGKTFFSFGAGGTGKSVCFELANHGAKKIYISSRSALCEELANEINSFYPDVCVAVRASDEAAIASALDDSEVLLNLSGSGMYPHVDETPISKDLLQSKHFCFDATYNPAQPRFLKEAEEKGCKTLNGLGMSVYQGARQVELWTGASDPTAVMFESIKKIISERK